MPAKPLAASSGTAHDMGPLEELADSGSRFTTIINVTVHGVSTYRSRDDDDDFEERVHRAIERRRRRTTG